MSRFERENIRHMQGYTSGEQPLDPATAKLNTNENPYPPSPAVAEELTAIDPVALRRYPPPLANDFRDLAASLHGVTRDNIIATRGGDELLRLVITTFVEPHETIAISDPTYSLYPVLAQIQDARVHRIPLEADFSLPDSFADEVRAAGAKLTFVVNPHAPSGQLRSLADITRLAARIDGLLLLDEAYVDFVDPDIGYDAIPLLESVDNVLILRSLSKGYSLAGLRFGYGIGPASLIEPMLTKTRDSYNLDYVSQRLAAAALADQEYATRSWALVRAERTRLRDALAPLGFDAAPSQGNFLLATDMNGPGSARETVLALKDEGILVRYFDIDRLCDKLRISIGTPEENDRLLAALTSHRQA